MQTGFPTHAPIYQHTNAKSRTSLTHSHIHTHTLTHIHTHTYPNTHANAHSHIACSLCLFLKSPRIFRSEALVPLSDSLGSHFDTQTYFHVPFLVPTEHNHTRNSWTDSNVSLEPVQKRLQTTDSLFSNVCEHCDRPVTTPTRHVLLDGQVFCKFSGRYQCRCGRWWNGMALKLQELNPSRADAFPEEHFPDCLTCGENYFVQLTGHQSPQAHQGETRRTDRGHQRQACTLCKAGAFCPRA